MSTFHERLKALRDESGKTQAVIAEDLGMTPQSFSYYLNGREPSYDTLIKIANYFNVSLDYLLGVSNCKTKDSENDFSQDLKELQNSSDVRIQSIIKMLVWIINSSNDIEKKPASYDALIILIHSYLRLIGECNVALVLPSDYVPSEEDTLEDIKGVLDSLEEAVSSINKNTVLQDTQKVINLAIEGFPKKMKELYNAKFELLTVKAELDRAKEGEKDGDNSKEGK